MLVLVLFSGTVKAQTWQSIPRMTYGNTVAYKQFSIDPYTDNIWVVGADKVAVIEPDGEIGVFTMATGEISWLGSNFQMAFTPNHTYFHDNFTGLYTFDSYTEQLVHGLISDPNRDYNISTNKDNDTVYMGVFEYPASYLWTYWMYTPSSFVQTERIATHIVAKDQQKYLRNREDFLSYTSGNSMFDTTWYLMHYDQASADPDYIGGKMYDLKFQNISDTLFVGGTSGISLIYNYDLLPLNYTPNNTTNMPSARVLEIEFDNNDVLWAVFGDMNGNSFDSSPIAIAKLEGTNWTSVFDANNSPIDFSEFVGLEFDSAGNLWVNDKNGLHTIVTATSPDWLSASELAFDNIQVYPNPTKDVLHISSKIKEETEFQVLDTYGRSILIGRMVNGTAILDISTYDSGIYFLTLNNEGKMIKIIKE
jgi:hypothetical protein